MFKFNVEIKHLRTLVTLREAGTISKAANLLCLTQSALSYQLKYLEEELGTFLFYRKSQPIQFTPAGERLLVLADEVLAKLDQAKRDMLSLSSGLSGELRLALECHTCFEWLMPVMDEFRVAWPDVELDIVSGFHSEAIQLLLDHKADIVIVGEQSDVDVNVQLFPLFSSEMVAILPVDHNLLRKDYLQASDFSKQTLITYPVDKEKLDIFKKILMPAQVDPLRRSTELTITMLQLVASGRGVAVLPYWAVHHYVEKEYVAMRSISNRGLWTMLYAAVRKENLNAIYYQEFIKSIKYQCILNLKNVF